MDWIINNAYSKDDPQDSVPFKNIVFVTHLGDVIEDGKGDEKHPEWLDSLQHMGKLDNVLPYSVTLGDHDYNGNERPVDGHSAFVKYYGPERYKSTAGTEEAQRKEPVIISIFQVLALLFFI